jgi:hypothetical protein
VPDVFWSQHEARGLAAVRAADAMLRALGGAEVTLLFPLETASVDPGSELGLASPTVEEVTVTPVCTLPAALKSQQIGVEFLFPASAVGAQVEGRGSSSAQAFFESAIGIVYEGKLLRVTTVVAEVFSGSAYLYRVVAIE